MNIIIVGCGKVGKNLAAQLSKEDNSICVVDIDGNVVHKLADTYDVMGIIGNGASYSVLQEADLENADLLIAVTKSDEVNLLCCMIAKKGSNCNTIARVRNPIYNKERHFLQEELGLSMIINPEFISATEISRILCFPNAIDVDLFSKGRAEMIRFRIPNDSILDNVHIKDLSSRIFAGVLICAIERDNEVTIPTGDFVLKSGDIVSMMSSRQTTIDFFHFINFHTHEVKNAMIVGGGKIAVYLAQMLLKLKISVKIIEHDPARCQELCEILPNATIICGDGTDNTLLIEERIDQTDALVTLTNYDEENILLALFAQKRVKTKVVSKINRSQLTEVIHNLNLDSVIYPKNLCTERILQYVRAKQNAIGSNIVTLYRLCDDKVEALEFNIAEKSKLTGVPLKNLNIKKGVLICCITRDDKLIIPGGDDVIFPGDSMIIVTTLLGLKDAQDILED